MKARESIESFRITAHPTKKHLPFAVACIGKMKSFVLRTALSSLACLALATGSAHAAVIFTEDFEDTGVADGNFTTGWTNTNFTASSVNSNLLNPAATGGTSAWLNPVPAELGNIFATVHRGVIMTANLPSLHFADNSTYTLSFTHFRRDDLVGDSVTAEIWSTSGSSALVSELFSAVTTTDTFVTRTIVYSTSGGSEVGQGIQLRFIDPSGGTNFQQAGIDNISLSVIPEPSTSLLLGGAAITAFLLRRKRRI